MTRTKSRLLLAAGIVASIASEGNVGGGGGGGGCDNDNGGGKYWIVSTTATLPPTTVAAGTTSLKFLVHAELYSSAPIDTYTNNVYTTLGITLELELGAAPRVGYVPMLFLNSEPHVGYIENLTGKIRVVLQERVDSERPRLWGPCLLSMTIPCYEDLAMEVTFPAEPAGLVRSISGSFEARVSSDGDDQPPRGTEVVLAIEPIP